MKAVYQGTVVARSRKTMLVEGRHYFPEQDVYMKFLEKSELNSLCPWKGETCYYHVEVAGKRCNNAAWCHPTPRKNAEQIKGYIGFSHDVDIIEE